MSLRALKPRIGSTTVLLGVLCVGCGMQGIEEVGSRLSPGDHEISIRSGGRSRLALVHVPPGPSTTPRPLVVAFHGGGGEARSFKEYAGLDAISDRDGFVVVYPYGTGVFPRRLLTFNAGANCCGYARDNDVDDVAFTLALIAEIERRIPIDPRRIYATGHSNGAMMSYRLAAEQASRIAAIAPVAAMMDLDPFAPERPVPVLHIHSVDDPRALYDGGLGPPFPLTNRRVMHVAVAEGLALWTERNGCAGEATIREERHGESGSINDGQIGVLLTWDGCSGAPVEHWRIEGVGHGWPGRVGGGPVEEWLGTPTTLIDAAEEAWRFLSRFAR